MKLFGSENPKKLSEMHLWEIRAFRDLFWIGFGFCLVWVGYYLRSIFTPILFALALAYVFRPLITSLEKKWGVSRGITIFSVFGSIIVLGICLVLWALPLVMEQLTSLANALPGYVDALGQRFGAELGNVADPIARALHQIRDNPMMVARGLFQGTSQAFDFLGSLLGATTYMLFFVSFSLLYFVVFSFGLDRLFDGFADYFPASRKKRFIEILGQMDTTVSSFFRGRILIALIMGAMLAFGWYITGVPYWLLLGFSTGLLSLIPYLSVLGWPLALLLKYLEATSGLAGGSEIFALMLWPSVVYVIVQFVEGWVLTPWIQSQSTELDSMTILLVVLLGGALAGMYGLILAVPVAACVKILLKELYLPKLRRWAETR